MLSCNELDAEIRKGVIPKLFKVSAFRYTYAEAETEKILLSPFKTFSFSEFNPLFDRYYQLCRENQDFSFGLTRMYMCRQFSYAIPTVVVLREIISFCGNFYILFCLILITATTGGKLLEIGSGTGYWLTLLSNLDQKGHYLGVDPGGEYENVKYDQKN
jgi:hypothetical protein